MPPFHGLNGPDPPVEPRRFLQIVVSAALCNVAAIQHKDLVGIRQRRQAMRDDDRCGPAAPFAKRFKYFCFRPGVHGAERVVENEDSRIFEQRPGEGNALALPPGQRDATLADHGVVAVLELEHRVVNARGKSRLRQFIERRSCVTHDEVFTQGLGIQKRLLHDDGNLTAKLLAVDGRNVSAVDLDGSFAQVIEAKQEIHDGRFPGPRRTKQSDGAAGRDAERDAIERRCAVVVRKRHSLEGNFAAPSGTGERVNRFRSAFSRMAEDFVNPPDRHGRLSEFGENPAHHPNRPDEHVHRRQKEEKCPDAEAPASQPHTTNQHDDGDLGHA